MNNPVFIKSFGILAPGINTVSDISGVCRKSPVVFPGEIKEIPLPKDMPARDARRMSRLTKLALFAADEACRNAGVAGNPQVGLFAALTHGTTSLLKEFHDYWLDFGPKMASPAAFSNGVTNALLGAISRHLKLTAGGLTLAGEEECGMSALHSAYESLQRNDYRFCCAGGAEEYSGLVTEVYTKLGWFQNKKSDYFPFVRPYGNTTVSEAACFCVLQTDHEKADGKMCRLSAIYDLKKVNPDADIIVSGLGGGPQDKFELDAVRQINWTSKKNLPVILPKAAIGETFSAGAMISAAAAWDMLVNNASYPVFRMDAKTDRLSNSNEFSDTFRPKTAIVISASRSGIVKAALLSMLH